MNLEQGMQVSTETLRAATTWHRHTDRVSGYTYHTVYLPSPMKGREDREQKHSTGMNGTQRELHVCTQLASNICEPFKTLY